MDLTRQGILEFTRVLEESNSERFESAKRAKLAEAQRKAHAEQNWLQKSRTQERSDEG